MPSALSVNLRERVVAAIEAGASRRQAAKRFGVWAASAVRWVGSRRAHAVALEGPVRTMPQLATEAERSYEQL
ncbi:IS630 transposase-related protein [Methylobacterium sp. Leaf361]|uniref:IS630 transposase-related protein n=1 Tax=Methylobacterium sp. Leaf361 TaxID=1736352 RepID=UPI00244EF537|nr:IS630 transposase-related protein [Methylobacterium sp. Leaf361]